MSFEIFDRSNAKRRGFKEPTVTISKAGSIRLNTAAMCEDVKDAEYAVFMYDADSKRIAIKPVEAGTENAYKIARPKSGGGNLSAGRFLAHIGVEHKETRRYTSEWDDEISAIVISLDK